MELSRADVARMLDLTLLRPEATPDEVLAMCLEATELGVGAVCVSPCHVELAVHAVGAGVVVCTVVGFPSGAVDSRIKAMEASLAFAAGATEIDMVANLGLIKSGDWDGLEADIADVAAAVPNTVLKVILETGVLTDAEVVEACRVARSAGADFVKTSTGFHPSGGATVEAVRLMAETVGEDTGVKASGGIRDASTARAMIEAGATRIGTSAGRAILDGW